MSPDKKKGKNPEQEDEKGEDENLSKEERLKRIKTLVDSRGKDAAAVLKMWMLKAQESRKKK